MDSAGEYESKIVEQQLVSSPPLREMRGLFKAPRHLSSKQHMNRASVLITHFNLGGLLLVPLLFCFSDEAIKILIVLLVHASLDCKIYS
jgi:hypothetical protein